MGLLLLESQPRFPEEDISDDSADLLEMMLQNQELVDTMHLGSKALLLYRLGHGALHSAAAQHIDDPRRLTAFSAGVAAFEAISILVKPAQNPDKRDDPSVSFSIVHKAQEVTHSLGFTLTEANDKFRSELPRTHYIIGSAARRFYQSYELYTQSGAAMAREIELLATQD